MAKANKAPLKKKKKNQTSFGIMRHSLNAQQKHHEQSSISSRNEAAESESSSSEWLARGCALHLYTVKSESVSSAQQKNLLGSDYHILQQQDENVAEFHRDPAAEAQSGNPGRIGSILWHQRLNMGSGNIDSLLLTVNSEMLLRSTSRLLGELNIQRRINCSRINSSRIFEQPSLTGRNTHYDGDVSISQLQSVVSELVTEALERIGVGNSDSRGNSNNIGAIKVRLVLKMPTLLKTPVLRTPVSKKTIWRTSTSLFREMRTRPAIRASWEFGPAS